MVPGWVGVRPVGERGVLIELETMQAVHALRGALETERPPGVEDVVAGARTVLLLLGDEAGDPLALAGRLPVPGAHVGAGTRRQVTIPVVYDGPDLEGVAAGAQLTPGEVARLHASARWTVGFLGFSPGFAYLFGGDPRLAAPRLASPRPSVPAGSVALAGGMTAVYPQATPGGWRLIGRSGVAMFDPTRREPALLAPGDQVRFEAVTQVPSPTLTSLRATLVAPLAGATNVVEVLEPGPLLTIQDRGRAGWAHAGVPAAGAADRRSAGLANQLAGNPPAFAVLEATGGRCRIRLRAARKVAVTGARAPIMVDGLPARPNAGLHLRAGSELAIGACQNGIRVYIALAGGIDVPPVLGSRSTDTLSGLGPPPLATGDLLALGSVPTAAVTPPTTGRGRAEPVAAGGPIHVVARLGPRDDWISASGLARLSGSEYTVSSASDRTGVRLDGPVVGLERPGEIPSEGMVPGAVQIPPGGQPIVLMRNHPPTGGYPVAAVVDDEGVDALAQAAPGAVVRFTLRP
jgi:KipI family sensor histidine kinase inhibitor